MLGSGGCGEVWEVVAKDGVAGGNIRAGQHYALKIERGDAQGEEYVANEWKTYAKLQFGVGSSFIPRIYERGRRVCGLWSA